MKRFFLLLVWLLALVQGAHAGLFEGIVVHVTDGDTVSVRPLAGGPQRQVRIAGIDAPEICQPFGPQSRDALAALVLNRKVRVQARAIDRYERTVARLSVRGQDVGGWLVVHGYAWSDRFRGHATYRRQEERARNRQLGLWANARPQAPHAFRQSHGSCRAAWSSTMNALT